MEIFYIVKNISFKFLRKFPMSLIFTENIRFLAKEYDLTIAEFAEKIGEKPSRLTDVLNGKQRPPFDIVEKILEVFDVDANWLIMGKKNNSTNNDSVEEFALVPFYDVEISAGFGRNNSDIYEPISHFAYRKDWLKQKRLHIDKLISTSISGDSMEPTIPDSSIILIDTSRYQPRDGHIYVLRNGDTYWVKRLQIQPDGKLVLISDNNFYPPMTLDLKRDADVEIIGQVVNVSKELF